MDNYDLKLCPFCGTKAKVSKTKFRYKHNAIERAKHTVYAIGCSDPECILYNNGMQARLFFTISKDGLENMKNRWNRRTVEK